MDEQQIKDFIENYYEENLFHFVMEKDNGSEIMCLVDFGLSEVKRLFIKRYSDETLVMLSETYVMGIETLGPI